MHPTELESCLDTLIVLVDSREQPTDQAVHRWKTFGLWERQKLNFGDYTAKCFLPDTTEFTLEDSVVIERKSGLAEIIGNFCERGDRSPDVVKWNEEHPDNKLRNRFEWEFMRAKLAGARVYLLIENASWEMILSHQYKSQMPPQSVIASLMAWQSRYGLSIIFCNAMTSGTIIKSILKYEMRERLRQE